MNISCSNAGKGHYVYIGANSSHVKIGTSVEPDNRMRIQKITPLKMSTPIMLFIAEAKGARVCISCVNGLQGGGTLKEALNETTRSMLADAIVSTGSNNSQIARDLGVARSRVISMRKRFDIELLDRRVNRPLASQQT